MEGEKKMSSRLKMSSNMHSSFRSAAGSDFGFDKPTMDDFSSMGTGTGGYTVYRPDYRDFEVNKPDYRDFGVNRSDEMKPLFGGLANKWAMQNDQSKKKILIIAAVTVLVLLIGVFGTGGIFGNSVVGTWECTFSGDIFTFNRNGTGSMEWRDVWSGSGRNDFRYRTRGNTLIVTELNGSSVEQTVEFRRRGNRLTLYEPGETIRLVRRWF